MDAVPLLTALIVLLMIAGFGFVGCGSFGTTPATPPDDSSKPLPYEKILENTAGFTAHWPLNETSDDVAIVKGKLAPAANGKYTFPGVTLADDTTGAVTQKGNVAPLFDGSKGYVQVPYQPSLNPVASLSFSIELWVKPKAGVPAANQVLVSSRSGGGNQRRGYDVLLVRDMNPPKRVVRARVFAPNVNEARVEVPITEGDEWRFVVCTFRGGAGAKLSLSVGVLGSAKPTRIENNTNVTYEAVPAGTSLRFGAGHQQDGDPTNFFAGWLDEIAFYSVALPVEDEQAHFNAATAAQ
jgi:hypothetical protein